MRIQRTTFPQRACEAARRIASSHRFPFLLPPSGDARPQGPLSKRRPACSSPPLGIARHAERFGQHACVAALCLFCHAQANYGAARGCRPWTTPEAIYHGALIRCAIAAQQILLSRLSFERVFASVCIPSCSSRKQTPRRGWVDSCTCCDEYCCGRCLSQELAI